MPLNHGRRCEARFDKRAGQSGFWQSTETVAKWVRKTHNPSVVGSSPTCPTAFVQVKALDGLPCQCSAGGPEFYQFFYPTLDGGGVM